MNMGYQRSLGGLALMLMLMLVNPGNIRAQDDGPKLTLSEAVSMALDKNPQIRKLEARLQGKSAEWKTGIGLSNPEISFAREGLSAISPEPYTEQRLAVQQEFDFPLTSFYRLKKVFHEKDAVARELEALRKEVSVGVKTRYTEILFCESIRELRAETYRLSKELDDAVKMRVESGVGFYMDQLSSEIRLVHAENQQYEANRSFHEARYRLFSFIGMNPDEQRYDIQFADTLFTHDELIEQEIALYTLEDQPLYKSAKALLAASDFAIKEAKSGFLPSVRLGYLAQDFGTGYHFRGFETGLTIPVWGMFNEKGRVEQAKSIYNERLWDQKSIELNIKEKIELAWHSYDNSQITIQLYQTQLKNKSEKLLALTQEAYRLGQIDLLKMIEAQQLYLSSQEKYLSALRDYYLRLIELEQYVNKELVY
jgi:cobalt-zinc-cadmium efflux system outer membrane protein